MKAAMEEVLEEVLKDDDVSAVDPEGELTKGDDVSAEVDVEREATRNEVGAKVDAEREVTGDEVSAKVGAEVGAKLTEENVVRVHLEDEVPADQVAWGHTVGDTEDGGEAPGPATVSRVVGEDGMAKQRTVPSCLRNRLSGSLDPPVILAWKHDCAGWPRHCLSKLDT